MIKNEFIVAICSYNEQPRATTVHPYPAKFSLIYSFPAIHTTICFIQSTYIAINLNPYQPTPLARHRLLFYTWSLYVYM